MGAMAKKLTTFFSRRPKNTCQLLRAGGRTPALPGRGPHVCSGAEGPHVTYGKNFLGACRCMTVVVL